MIEIDNYNLFFIYYQSNQLKSCHFILGIWTGEKFDLKDSTEKIFSRSENYLACELPPIIVEAVQVNIYLFIVKTNFYHPF